jgi:hypothetical protein
METSRGEVAAFSTQNGFVYGNWRVLEYHCLCLIPVLSAFGTKAEEQLPRGKQTHLKEQSAMMSVLQRFSNPAFLHAVSLFCLALARRHGLSDSTCRRERARASLATRGFDLCCDRPQSSTSLLLIHSFIHLDPNTRSCRL